MTGLPRQKGKTISMALITGAGTNKIIEMMGMTEAEGKPLVYKYHDGIPEIKQFQKKATKKFLERGWVSSILGRRFHLDDPRYAYRALSRIIQGANADIVKAALVKCYDLGRDKMGECVVRPLQRIKCGELRTGGFRIIGICILAEGRECYAVKFDPERTDGLQLLRAPFKQIVQVIWENAIPGRI
jgi:hypothetical protein